MSAAAAAILEGMPDPRDLYRLDSGGETAVFAGTAELFRFAEDDTAMRHVAAAVLRQLNFPGKDVAAVLGLSPELRGDAAPAGAAGGDGGAGPAGGTAPGDRRGGVGPGAAVAGRRGAGRGDRAAAGGEPVHRAAAAGPGARAGPAAGTGGAEPADTEPEAADQADADDQADAEGTAQEPGGLRGPASPVPPGPVPPAGGGQRPAEPVTVRSRYAGAMLLHAFAARAGAGDIFRAAAGQDAAPQDVALLAAVSACFALGAATTEQFKHLAAAEAGPLAGLSRLPGLRTLRPGLAAIADRADPLDLQRMFAAAMLDADPVTSGVYYVDDHFVPYTGAKPVPKGWNNKRGRAERGRADTHVTAHDGRAVCFISGEPSGLSVTLPKALAELKKAAGPGATIMLGFDRGGAYPQVFRHCREQNVHWVTYRRAPLAVSAMLPVITTATIGGKTRTITWAEEKVQLKDYGEARQLTLFEHGKVVLQILTSDFDACPADILSWLKSRWREENFLKYASENYGIDKICDYAAAIETNTKITANPARKAANTAAQRAGEGGRRRRARLRRAARRPGHHRRRQERCDPRRRARDQRRAQESTGRGRRPGHDPGETARRPDRSRSPHRRAAHRPPRPADGAPAARAQRRALARQLPQRLPTRRRRIPRHHPRDHHPRPGRNDHLHPRRDDRRPPGTRRTPRRTGPRPGHRRDQRPAARHPRRHPAHHLPHPPAAANLIRGPAASSGDLGPAVRASRAVGADDRAGQQGNRRPGRFGGPPVHRAGAGPAVGRRYYVYLDVFWFRVPGDAYRHVLE